MSANKTSTVAAAWEGWDVAPRKKPGRWEVSVGYFRDASGLLLLLPILSHLPEGVEVEEQSPGDWAFIGPVYRPGERGFDLLSRANGDFVPPFPTKEDFQTLLSYTRRRTELVLLVGPDETSPEWVAAGVGDGKAWHPVGFNFRFGESSVADWLWAANLPRVVVGKAGSRR
jgi:hypothetical protein